jgi:hypothetical protein
VSLVVALALGQLPRSHPLIPSLHFKLSGSSSPLRPAITGSISLPAAVTLGSFLTLHGTLPAGETGIVTVDGAYEQGAWQTLASVPAADGSYEARIPLNQSGLLRVRVTYPDGRQSEGETQVG